MAQHHYPFSRPGESVAGRCTTVMHYNSVLKKTPHLRQSQEGGTTPAYRKLTKPITR